MFFYCPIVLIMEFVTSYLLNSGAISIFSKKVLRAGILSVLTNICTWSTFYIVVKLGDWNVLMMIFASSGDVAADMMVAARWPKGLWRLLNPKKKPDKKTRLPVGVTTA